MTRHNAPAGADLWNAPRTLTLNVPLWDESTEHQPRTLRVSTRAMQIPVILWPELEVAGAVVHAQGYATVETFIVLREWNAQVLLHEVLHVALGGVIPAAQDGTGGHDVIGAVEVALAPFVTFPAPVSSGEAGTGEAGKSATGAIFESWCDQCEVTIETESDDEVNAFNREHDHPVDAEYGHIDIPAPAVAPSAEGSE